jgi:pimeloyl-ACP methyl ester carboxylesterase
MTLPVNGFRLAYQQAGRGPAVVLLHGWPGDRSDYREVVPLLSSATEVVVPDLRGFDESDKHRADPADRYSADAQARSVVGLIEQLGLDRPVLGGYEIGSRIAQSVARGRHDLVRALVVSPPLPGIGAGSSPHRSNPSSGTRAFTNSTSPTSSSTAARRRCGHTCSTSGPAGPDRVTR